MRQALSKPHCHRSITRAALSALIAALTIMASPATAQQGNDKARYNVITKTLKADQKAFAPWSDSYSNAERYSWDAITKLTEDFASTFPSQCSAREILRCDMVRDSLRRRNFPQCRC